MDARHRRNPQLIRSLYGVPLFFVVPEQGDELLSQAMCHRFVAISLVIWLIFRPA